MKKVEREKKILWISFLAGLIFAVAEFFFSIFSGSQSVLMDAVYDASELIFIALILFMTPLFYQPVSEKHPYGFYQLESILLIIKGFMMLSVTFSVSVEVIQAALSGGNLVDEAQISMFQFVLGLVSLLIFLIMKKMNHAISSPTVEAEILEWKLDILYSLGLSAAFYLSTFLGKTKLAFLVPYFDPLVAVVVMLLMMPENIRLLWRALKDVFLFSPDDETVNTIKEMCDQVMAQTGLFQVSVDVTRTGRRMWVSVYFETDAWELPVEEVKQVTAALNSKVSEIYKNCTCELILAT